MSEINEVVAADLLSSVYDQSCLTTPDSGVSPQVGHRFEHRSESHPGAIGGRNAGLDRKLNCFHRTLKPIVPGVLSQTPQYPDTRVGNTEGKLLFADLVSEQRWFIACAMQPGVVYNFCDSPRERASEGGRKVIHGQLVLENS